MAEHPIIDTLSLSNRIFETVELAERNHARLATRTARATQQATYRTTRHDSVFGKTGEYTDLPVEAAEAFAVRPSADVIDTGVVELFAWLGATVANEIRRVEDEFDLDARLVGVGIGEPAKYSGTFIETTRDDLLEASSPVLRVVPDDPDVLVMHPRITYGDVGSTVLNRTDADEHLVDPEDGMLDPETVPDGDAHEGARSPSRERPDDGQRMLSHFDSSVVAEGEATFDADGEAGDG
jgi:hypothetical protein